MSDETLGVKREALSEPASASRVTHHASRITALASSCAALVIVFMGLVQFDLPVTRYLRTLTTHLPGEQLTIPWMAFTSNAGDWIGEGSHLIAVSVVFLAAGWAVSKPILKTAGIETLLAHGIAGLVSNGLKHLLGRPRPKFVHSGEWQLTPSWASGLDSFPSGHTTASFAVATVLAKRFPAFGPLCVSVAAFVALSRVLRGSHFPTDVFGGAVFGVLSGSLASAPWREWRTSLQRGLLHAAVGTAGIFTVLWTLSHQADEGPVGLVFMGLGAVALAAGLWLRVGCWSGNETASSSRQEKASLALTAYGLASMTTAPLVMASVGLAGLASWLHAETNGGDHQAASIYSRVVKDTLLAVGVLMACAMLIAARGVLPFR